VAGRHRRGTRCHDRLLIPLLKTRGFSSLPVHFLGKAATFSLLYAFPLVLLGSGEQGWLQLAWVLAGRSRSGAPLCTGTPEVSTLRKPSIAPPSRHSTTVSTAE
jgi:hypothetical protein